MTHGLVEGNLRERSAIDIAEKIFAILEMLRPVGGARSEPGKIVERLVVRLKLKVALVARIDDLPFCFWRLATIGHGQIPASGVPRPTHALVCHGVTDGSQALRRQRCSPLGSSPRVGKVAVAAGCRRKATRLVRRLSGVDRITVGRNLTATGAKDLNGAFLRGG